MLQGLGSQGSGSQGLGSQISLSKVTGSQIARFAKTLFRHLAKFMSTLVLTLGVVSVWLAGQPGMLPPVFADDHVMHPLYLPLVQNAPQAGPTTQPTTAPTGVPTTGPTPVTPAPATPTPPVEPLASAFFADMQWRTSSASFATDAQGGNHLAYLYYNGLAEDVPTSGVYQFCARDCEKADQWQGVRLGEQVNEIQLALTPQGRPRILYRTPTQSNGWAFFYAACDDRCADAASWSVTQVTSNQGMAPLEKNDDELPQRYFALDNGGRPRFVYNDRAGTHYGTFYTFCDANCNERSNWHETRINKDNGNNGPYRDEDFFYPVLTFSPSGQPRVVADGASMQDEFFLYYVACDSGCDQAANWQSAPIFPRGFGFEFSYDVEINANGQPRIAIYEAAYLGGGGNVLSYAWCNEQCTQPAKWQRQALGLESLEGQEPDLELDAAGRPHIAYASYRGGGVGYSTCSAACESTEPTWQHTVVETRTDLDNAWPVAMPLICSGGIWDGLTPSLSLDANGAPHIAYDATFYARCHYVGEDKWEPWNEMNLVWRAVRVRLTGHGATPGTPGGTPTSVPTVTQTPTPSVTPTATTSPAPTVTATPTPPLPARLGTGSFPESAWRTSSSDVAVDEANGTHVAYVYTEALYAPDPDGDSNPTAAVYRTCAAACEQAQNWSSVTLGADVSEVQVEVTAEGKPRLLLLVRAEQNGAAADRYVYAECNQQCTNAANWLLTPIVTVPNDLSRHWIADPSNIEDGGRENQARRYFALDPAGRPRFIYYHYNADADPTGVGAYYAACDSNCTDAANWSHTRITAVDDWSGVLEWEVLEDPVLTFAPDGSPRILAPMLPLGILRFPGLYYIACDAACDMSSSWVKVQVGNGDDASGQYDLALDQAGRPFVVISYWWQAGLRYAWCDSGCSDMFNWQVAQGPELEIGNPALALNGQDQPQVVYSTTEYDETGNNADHSLYWLQCDANCRSTDALWSTVRVETSEHLRAEWPKNIPAACAAGEWSQLAPAVSIAAGGLAHIAVDVVYVAPCEYDAGAGTWQSGQYSTVWRAARVVSLPTP